MRAMVIANPTSGNGRCGKAIPEIQRILNEKGIRYSFFISRYSGYTEELARKAKGDGFQMVVACGGDGTVNEVVNGIVGTGIILGIIPMGRGGDLASNLAISKDIATAISNIHEGFFKNLDVVRVNGDRYYLGVGGIGFDSEVNRWVNEGLRFIRGKVAYTIAAIARIPVLKYKRVRISFDEGDFDGDILLVAFGNTRSYGGGMYITPDAEMDDGLLDICLIGKINRLRLLYVFPRVFRGTHTGVSGVMSYRSRHLSVESDTPLDLYGDGEFICKTPFSMEVVPGVLNVIAPSG